MNKYFQTSIQYGAPVGRIDRERGIIHGITIARSGPARGHGGSIDKTALLQIVDLAATRPQGIKARFGHPNMCNTALGTYLGRFHNYSYNFEKVTADLHLDASAKETPHGNLYDYVLKLAESNPDMFGASIVFENDKFHVEKFKDEAGNDQELKFFRIKDLRATDIVDDPAATDGLFSTDSLPSIATQFLDENPEFSEFLFSHPESLFEFLTKYLESMNLPDQIKERFKKLFNFSTSTTEETPPIAEVTDVTIPVAVPDPETFEEEISENVSLSEYNTQLATIQALETQLADAISKIESLQNQLNVRQSIPTGVGDPGVIIPLEEAESDNTGKEVIKNMPRDLRAKIK